ncbi:MAG: hypothetical protein PUG89_07955, partial [Succinivibrio sp.]|nr:hypothetical protein [Succinivibrio sp.]
IIKRNYEKIGLKLKIFTFLALQSLDMNFLFHGSTVSVDWSNTFMNVGANKIKYWRRKIAAFPLIGAKFLNY